MLLEPIFEQDFKSFSYGFRPGRSAHEALTCIWSQCMHRGIKWIVEVDIRKYFDTLKKEGLRKFLDRRVGDGVIRRLIGKWLAAGVSLHPEKTRLVPFGCPEETTDDQADSLKPESFDFLGFTHFWGKSRQGRWIIRRKTMRKRFTRGLKAISQWCRQNLHKAMLEQVEQLGRKLKGHFGYYGITGNTESLQRFRWEVIGIWRKWLARRGDPKGMSWERMHKLLAFFYIPEARVVHSIYAAKP
ncbi:MAG TPA: reverse transcriptase domain-containing protein [Acidobacteriota bacterium]|jgi:hypothetical protein